jgi:hypothetical protein
VYEKYLHADLHNSDNPVGNVDDERQVSVVVVVTNCSGYDGEEHVEEGEDSCEVEQVPVQVHLQ